MAHWVKAKTTTNSALIIKAKSGQKSASHIKYGPDNATALSAIVVLGSPEEFMALPRVA